ncbi:MAG: hypothetical protein KDE04_17785 [Anaerolineales bacterium]|nr:hypothetical protein [Anaerolineales bacterium]MCB8959211.1 hypothetical protein [Ardenticatenales bacterium]
MAEVQGIGGVFIDSQDAVALARWYEEVLGIQMEGHPDGSSFYRVFPTRDAASGILRGNPVFAINQAEGDLATGSRGFTLNLRVDDFEAFMADMRTKGVAVDDNVIIWEQGKHGWIRDLDGNRIELYEELFPDGSAEEKP